MTGWTLLDIHPVEGHVFHRPLDSSETAFIWGSFCDGAADGTLRIDLRLPNGAKDAQLFSDSNIVNAWLSTKRRYPLIGATIQPPPGDPPNVAASQASVPAFLLEPHFFVRERDLAVLRARDIVFEHVTSAEGVDARIHEILDGPRPLSQDLLAQLYVFRETGKDDVLHVMILITHCVADVTVMSTIVRCFLDMLAQGGVAAPMQVPLEERLAMAVPLAEREPRQLRVLSPARRRWQKAIATLIFQSRMEKMQGGHTLPCRITSSTSFIAARSRNVRASITREETAAILTNCRRLEITFGNACIALAQVAMTRVLYRRYLRGDISEEEWAYRKKEPQLIAGPCNLRRYLDKTWFENGGGGESALSISTFFYRLPFMPLGDTEGRYWPHGENLGLSDGAPPFSELLTFGLFLHRAGLVQRQADAMFQHPLFLELAHAWSAMVESFFRQTTLQRLEHTEDLKNSEHEDTDESDLEVLAVTDMPVTLAHGGSSFGNLDSILPREYPLPPTHPLSPFSSVPHPSKAGYVVPSSVSAALVASGTDGTAPTVVVQDVKLYLHTRPAELYLGAWSTGGRLSIFSFYDNNVFEEAVVKEWMDEIKEAVLWYLGQSHESHRVRRDHAGSAEAKTKLGGRAKL